MSQNEIDVVLVNSDTIEINEQKEIREVVSKALRRVGCAAGSQIEFKLDRYIHCKRSPSLQVKKILISSIRVVVSTSSNRGFKGYIVSKGDKSMNFDGLKELIKSFEDSEIEVNLGNNGSGYLNKNPNKKAAKKQTPTTEKKAISLNPVKKETDKLSKKKTARRKQKKSGKDFWKDETFQELFLIELEEAKNSGSFKEKFSANEAVGIFNNGNLRETGQKLSSAAASIILSKAVEEKKIRLVSKIPFKIFHFQKTSETGQSSVTPEVSEDSDALAKLDELMKEKEELLSKKGSNDEIITQKTEENSKITTRLSEIETEMSSHRDLYEKLKKFFG